MLFKKYFKLLPCLFVAMCTFGLTSCSDDDDDPVIPPISEVDENEVIGTRWIEESSYSDGTSSTTVLTFSSSTATLSISYNEGTQTLTNTFSYSFRRSKNLVLLSPKEAGNASLEGTIESGFKMTLINTSNNSVVAVLYKR